MSPWCGIITFATEGNTKANRVLENSSAEWRELLNKEQFHLTHKQEARRLVNDGMSELFRNSSLGFIPCANFSMKITNVSSSLTKASRTPMRNVRSPKLGTP